MAKIFYLHEILKFALEKEKQSFELYNNLSGLVGGDSQSRLFLRLAEEEKGHIAFFEEMLASTEVEQSPKVHEDEEYDAYMQELIQASRHTKPIVDLEKMQMNEILDYAIAREKDSILFYSGLKDSVPENDKNYIADIINEEIKHVTLLVGLK